MDIKCKCCAILSFSVDGVEPVLFSGCHGEETLAELTSLHAMTAASSLQSSELEWDHGFVSTDDLEQKQLLDDIVNHEHSVDRKSVV